jgi:hypothetical protein
MLPFRVYDREKKEMWVVINYHPEQTAYLAAREDDTEIDGLMRMLPVNELTKMRLVDFLEDSEEFNG